MKKKLAWILVFTLFISSITLSTFAADVQASGPFAGGTGTEDDPYLISDIFGFIAIGQGLDRHYKLISDVDFSLDPNWTPLGEYFNHEFSGSIDGNGYSLQNLTSTKGGLFRGIRRGASIKNLKIENFNIDVTDPLFYPIGAISDYINGSTIENVKLINSNIKSTESLGSLIGRAAENTIIKNVEVVMDEGYILEGKVVGGLVGEGFLHLSDSKIQVNIIADEIGGGIVGRSGGAPGNINVINSEIIANIEAENFIGGIIGEAASTLRVDNITISGELKNADYMGGVIGYSQIFRVNGTYRSHRVTASRTISNVNISSNKESNTAAGFFAGYDNRYSSYKQNVWQIETAFTGNIEGHYELATGLSWAYSTAQDGFVSGKVSNSNTQGNLSMTYMNFEYEDGRTYHYNMHVVGDMGATENSRVFRSNTTSVYSLEGKYNGIEGLGETLSPFRFLIEGSFAGWDFDDVWEITNGQYPTLKRAGVQGEVGYIDPNLELEVSVTNKSETSVTIEWNDVGAASYTVLRDGEEIATVTDLSYTDSGLSPNETYEYEVEANY